MMITSDRPGSPHSNRRELDIANLCFIPDAKDDKPHSAHGMAEEVTVASNVADGTVWNSESRARLERIVIGRRTWRVFQRADGGGTPSLSLV
jgi:hypothetical protein